MRAARFKQKHLGVGAVSVVKNLIASDCCRAGNLAEPAGGPADALGAAGNCPEKTQAIDAGQWAVALEQLRYARQVPPGSAAGHGGILSRRTLEPLAQTAGERLVLAWR